MKVLVAQLCPTLCESVECNPPGSSVHGVLQSKILELGSHSLLPGFLTQGLNPGLLHHRQIPCRSVPPENGIFSNKKKETVKKERKKLLIPPAVNMIESEKHYLGERAQMHKSSFCMILFISNVRTGQANGDRGQNGG